MKVNLREIKGNWDAGYALDKHMLSSVYLGDDEYGHARFDNTRTEVGEALFQLKYRGGSEYAEPLAQAIADNIGPILPFIGLIVPMPATSARVQQPVTEVAVALGRIMGKPVFHNLLFKQAGGQKMKDIPSREAKVEAVKNAFSYKDEIAGDGKYDLLLVDDLYDSGATAEAAVAVLRTYRKVGRIYVAALTSKR